MRTLLVAVVGTLLGATAALGRRGADLLPRRPAHPADQLPDLPSPRRGGADVARHLRAGAAVGARDQEGDAVESRCRPGSPNPGIAHYANEHEKVLSAQALDTLARWADGGAPAGDPATAPPARVFPSGWNITPDVVVEMPKPFELPARGTINYKYVLVKTNFPEDMWVVAAEMRPGDPAVLHHGKVWVRPPGSKWMEKAEPGEAYETETQRDILGRNSVEEGNDILGKFNPGLGPQRFDRQGAAKFIPKGSDLVFELHYTTSGKPASDVSKLGLVLTKTPPDTRYFFHAGPTALNLAIPPNDGKAEVVSEVTLGEDARLVYAQPHMHLRGKDFELRVVSPEGVSQTVLKGRFDFEWQMGYELAEPVPIPKGSKLQFITHFDNSKGNRFNPNPETKVLWGPQNWDEMSNCFIGVLFDRSTAPGEGLPEIGSEPVAARGIRPDARVVQPGAQGRRRSRVEWRCPGRPRRPVTRT